MSASDRGPAPSRATPGDGPGAEGTREGDASGVLGDAARGSERARERTSAPVAGAAPADSSLLEELVAAPFPERIRLVCRAWALQLAPIPLLVMAAYWLK